MPLDPVIAQGFRGIQLQDPLEQYARANQLLQAQQQNQLNALKMQEYQREREVENKLAQLFQRPGADPTSPEFMREVYGISPLKGAAFQKSALETQKAQREAAEAEDKRKKAAADLAASYVKQARDQLPMVSDPQTYAAWRAQTLQRLPGFESLIPTDYSPQIVQRLALDADKMLEQHFVTQNLGGGQQVVSMPKYGGGSSTVVPGSFAAEVPLPPAVEAQKARVAKAGATSLNVGLSTERKYSEQFAGNVAKADEALLSAAQNAPSAAENANRILTTLASGKAITGPLADVKLNIARALNVAGADNADMISKTESLVASMAENTLNAIKTSGLGTGQGFTNKDLEFLEKAKSGNINFQPDTIRQLAELAHRAAEKTAEKWSNRVKQIPKSALEGTGVSTEPITVPKRASSVTATARPSGVGPDWTLMQDANGRKAWVSPDGKQHKEVQ